MVLTTPGLACSAHLPLPPANHSAPHHNGLSWSWLQRRKGHSVMACGMLGGRTHAILIQIGFSDQYLKGLGIGGLFLVGQFQAAHEGQPFNNSTNDLQLGSY